MANGRTLILAVIALMLTESFASAESVVLLSSVRLNRATIFLNDLLPATAPDCMRQGALHIALGKAPLPGTTRVFRRDQILHSMAGHPELLERTLIPERIVAQGEGWPVERQQVDRAISVFLRRQGEVPDLAAAIVRLDATFTTALRDQAFEVEDSRPGPAPDSTYFFLRTVNPSGRNRVSGWGFVAIALAAFRVPGFGGFPHHRQDCLEGLTVRQSKYSWNSLVSLDIIKIRDDLVAKVHAAAQIGHRRRVGRARSEVNPSGPASICGLPHVPPSVVALGTSTGGPKALQQILPMLPADLPVGMLIVQHMPPGFTGPFARRLNNLCKVSVIEAEEGSVVTSGVVYIAPAGRHMTVQRVSPTKVVVHLSQHPQESPHIPSVDVMMLSVAETYRALSMGIILTGMGADGVQGMQAIARHGGLTVGQDEFSCIVYGMPRSCAEAGVLKRVVSLAQIPEQILQAIRYRHRA